MARIFLYTIAAIVALVIVAAIGLAVFWEDAERAALSQLKPEKPYAETPRPPAPDYADPASWALRPGGETPQPPIPEGVETPEPPAVDVFYLHPTTYLETAYWNAPIDAQAGDDLLARALESQAGAFAAAGRVYAPRYRQAAFGAFLVEGEGRQQALATAYGDLAAAFQHYIAQHNAGRPFLLVGHSQGALHGLRLLQEEIAGTALADRLVAAYLPGWPVARKADLAALEGIGPCRAPEETGCVVSWQTFSEGGDPGPVMEVAARLPGLTGRSKRQGDIVCVNPISWRMDAQTAPKSAHDGAVAPSLDPSAGLAAPLSGLVSARCGADGFVYVSPAPEGPFTTFLLPGGNYHVYDIHLFYMDIRANARARAEAFLARGQASRGQ